MPTTINYNYYEDKYFKNPLVDGTIGGINAKEVKSFPLSGSISEKYKLATPINVKLEFKDGEYYCNIPELQLYAFSKNLKDAIEEIKEDLIDLIDEVYFMDDKYLGKNPLLWKKILNDQLILKK